jgi:carboxypeptidase Taq
MPDSTNQTYELVCRHARETAWLSACESVLGWDERTMMPPEAAEFRAEQMAFLAGLVHQRRTDQRLGDWLSKLSTGPLAADAHSDTGANIRQLKRTFDRSAKLPQSLVEELTRTASLGQHVWQQARAGDDFAMFAPLLEKTIELKRAQAEALGYDDSPYDALLEDFEPGERAANLTVILANLRDALVPLVAAIKESGREPDTTILTRQYNVGLQEAFGRQVATQIGFDFRRGRLDVTAHPFCASLGPHDCRLTTRYDDNFFPTALFGILHEAGHGIYDQGLRPGDYGLPLGDAISLGIHESQSRMWENLVGRSRAFWSYFYPRAQQTFAQALDGVSLDDFYFAINDVRPSLIRVEADEATYNLHILIRFELEQALLSDELQVAELPTAWRDKYQKYLGIVPPNDADGSLQDIHWAAGLIGYFPTYSLGNLYAAQFFDQAEADLSDLNQQFARGEFAPLHNWLKQNIHDHGQRYFARTLIERVTGRPLSHEPLVRRLRDKLAPLYKL